MRGIWGIDPGWGLTALRVAMAVVLIHAGYVKWFEWGVPTGVTASMTKYGLPLPEVSAYVVATLELVGGLALLIGLFARWVGLLLLLEFAIAYFYVKLRLQGFMSGWLELMLLGGGLALFLAGPGRAAVDEVWLEKGEAAPPVMRRAA